MTKIKKRPIRIEIIQLDNETNTVKSDIDDPNNLFLEDKIKAGDGITVSLIKSFENDYMRITSSDYNTPPGIRYKIPTGIAVIVRNNFQYLIKDNLYLTGGSITLLGDAQLVIH